MMDHSETKTVRLSRRLTVTLTASRLGITAEWIPEIPRDLTPKEMRRYRQARDGMLRRLGERLGCSVVVVEVGAWATLGVTAQRFH